MEDYKKKYENALEKARVWKEKSGMPIDKQGILDDIFPELKESEDEKIRKELIRAFTVTADKRSHEIYGNGITYGQVLAWLEKQSEQKSQGKSVLEVWKDMRLEVYQQASGNRHEPNYSDDSTKMFSLTNIDEIFEKVAKKQGEQNNKHLYDVIIALWDLLDKIDTFSDLQIDDTNPDNPFKKIEYIAQERHKFVKSDGYNLYIQGEQITDFKQSKQKPADKCIGCNNFKGCITCTDGDQYAHITEQKPTDNLEPKFKVGDWIVQEGVGTYKVVEVYKWYEVIGIDGNQYSISFLQENDCHFWTIQDAKDGDILVTSNGGIFIFDNTVEDGIYPFAYCGLTKHHWFEVYDRKLPFTHDNDVLPATEEQRDLLFSKMHEAGYEWDAEKKELNLFICSFGNADKWELVEQKPAWSEKDEKTWSTISDLLWEGYKLSDKKVSWHKIRCWLLPKITYFKDRVQTHPKQEWSEEDEKMFNSIIEVLEVTPSARFVPIKREIMIPWLKSLKERMKGE